MTVFESYWERIADSLPGIEDDDTVLFVAAGVFRGQLYKAFHEGCLASVPLEDLKQGKSYRKVFEDGFEESEC